MFFSLSYSTQIVFDYKFGDWVDMCLQNNRPGKLFGTPYFMPAFSTYIFKATKKQVSPEGFEGDIFQLTHYAYAGRLTPVSNFLYG